MADGLSNVYAYTLGSISENAPAYSAGKDTALDSSIIYLHGQDNVLNNTPSHSHGLDTDLSSTEGYLRGGINQSSSESGYLAGISTGSSDVSAYADCQPGYIDGSTPTYSYGVHQASSDILAYSYGVERSYNKAYANGNLFEKDSQSAFVNGLTAAISGAIHVYIPEPVLRSSIHTTFGGIAVAGTDYIWFKTSDAGVTLSKKFRFIAENYDDGTLEKAEKINKTIGGGLDHSVGGIYKTWSPIVKVRHEETETDFGNRDDLEYFWSLNDPNGTPSNDITFIDHHQTEYIVHMVGKMTKNLLGTQVDGYCAWYLYKINLMRVQ
jgi:hypothetical protein